MINVTDATKSAYIGDSINKTLTINFPNRNITFNNSDIVSESFELTESIETERYLTFKGCIASQCKFQVAENVQDLRGEYVTVTIKAGNTQTIDLFKGYVDEQNNETQEDIITEFICYDALYKIGSKNMQSWVDGLTFPITVKNLRNSLFSNLGIAQESKTLINDSLSISENFKTFCDNPSATDIMKWICEVNAVFGQIGRDGKFKYRELKEISEGLYPSETTYPGTTTYPSEENVAAVIDTSHYINLEYEPYEVDFITKVVIYDSGGLDVAYSGSGTNVFGLTDNPIAFSVNMTKACQAILAKVGSINYLPVISMECVGLPYIECGDNYTSYTKRNVCRTYVLQRTLKGIQALKDNYSSDSDRNRPEHKATAISRTNSNKQTILDVQADIVQFKKVVADEITATNAKFNNLDASKITTGTLSANRIGADTITVNKLKGNISKKDTGTTTAWELDFTGNGSLKIGEINASKITAGYISADRIKADSIDVEKLTGTIKDSSKSWEINLNKGTMKIGTLAVGQITGNISSTSASGGSGWKIDFDTGTLSIGEVKVNKIFGQISGQDYEDANPWTVDFTTGKINFGQIDAKHIKAHSIEVKSKLTGTIYNGSGDYQWGIDFQNGTMKIGKLEVGKITGNIKSDDQNQTWNIDFNEGKMSIGKLAVGQITGNIEKADYSGATKWKIDFTNGTMTIGDIDASHIKAETITADKIVAKTITADEIADNTIGNSKVSLSASDSNYGWGVSFGSNTGFTKGNLPAGNLTSGYVSSLQVNAEWKSVRAIKSVVWGYLYQHNSTKAIVLQTTNTPPTPSGYNYIGEVCRGVKGTTLYSLCQTQDDPN